MWAQPGYTDEGLRAAIAIRREHPKAGAFSHANIFSKLGLVPSGRRPSPGARRPPVTAAS
jgi:hypothetical protein